MDATLRMGGRVGTRVIRGTVPAPLAWKIRNAMRWSYIQGWVASKLAQPFTDLTGLRVVVPELRAIKIGRNGLRTDYGVISRHKVTDTGVGFIVDAWQNSVELEIMKYHGCGTGTAAEAQTDSTLQTECTTVLNPDSTRATGNLGEGATANIFKTVGTLVFDNTAAVTEHGLCSTATSTYVLFDRSVFSAINVISGDSIEFTYQATFTAGG